MEQEAPHSLRSVSPLIVYCRLKVYFFITRHLRTNDPAGTEEVRAQFDWKLCDVTGASGAFYQKHIKLFFLIIHILGMHSFVCPTLY